MYLYIIVHLLAKEFEISLKSSLSAQLVCHTRKVLESKSGCDFGPGVGVWVRVGVWSPGFF